MGGNNDSEAILSASCGPKRNREVVYLCEQRPARCRKSVRAGPNWQAHVRGGQVRWRVAEKDFDTGPFRWVVYDKEGGRLLAMSASFTLPDSGSQTVTVTVLPVAAK